MALEKIVRLPDEAYEEFFVRAVKKAVMEQKSFLVKIGDRYVDVHPDTPVAFLEGYLAGSK